MKKEVLYISVFLAILLIIFFIVRSLKVTDAKIEEFAEKEVSLILHDPYTAKFTNVTVSKKNEDKNSSVTYNSKNLYGAYTGNKQFYMLILSSSGSISTLNKPMIEDSRTYGGIVSQLCNE